MTKMTKVPHSGRIDVSEWNWSDDTDEQLKRLVSSVLRDVYDFADKKDEHGLGGFGARLPIQYKAWGGKEESDSDGIGGSTVADPLTIDVDIPVGDECEGPVWRTTLGEIIDEAIGNLNDSMDCDVVRKMFLEVRNGLVREVQKIDAAMRKGRWTETSDGKYRRTGGGHKSDWVEKAKGKTVSHKTIVTYLKKHPEVNLVSVDEEEES